MGQRLLGCLHRRLRRIDVGPGWSGLQVGQFGFCRCDVGPCSRKISVGGIVQRLQCLRCSRHRSFSAAELGRTGRCAQPVASLDGLRHRSARGGHVGLVGQCGGVAQAVLSDRERIAGRGHGAEDACRVRIRRRIEDEVDLLALAQHGPFVGKMHEHAAAVRGERDGAFVVQRPADLQVLGEVTLGDRDGAEVGNSLLVVASTGAVADDDQRDGDRCDNRNGSRRSAEQSAPVLDGH